MPLLNITNGPFRAEPVTLIPQPFAISMNKLINFALKLGYHLYKIPIASSKSTSGSKTVQSASNCFISTAITIPITMSILINYKSYWE